MKGFGTAKSTRFNIGKDEKLAFQHHNRNSDIVIVLSNNSNSIVVLCNSKITSFLNTSLVQDPTPNIEREITLTNN